MTLREIGKTFLNSKTYNYLCDLIEDEGEWILDYMNATEPMTSEQAHTPESVVTFIGPFNDMDDEIHTYEEQDAIWKAKVRTMTLEQAVEYMAKYHDDRPSHGEAIGSSILEYEIWRHAANADLMVKALNKVIRYAAKHGVDH